MAATKKHSCRAIVCHDELKNGGWKMENVTLRDLKEGELMVEIIASGICHSDVIIGDRPGGIMGTSYPRVLGHEGSGYRLGDPVLLSFNFCGKCPICKSGHPAHCTDFVGLNLIADQDFSLSSRNGEAHIGGGFFGQSSFANFSIVRHNSVVNVKDLVADKNELQLFAPLGCAVQTGSGTVINVAQATKDDTIVIMGLGGVGLSAIMAAKIAGCKTVIGVDRIESRMQLAKELGATHTVNTSSLPDGQKIGDVMRDLNEGVGPSITIDTTGVVALVEAGLDFTRNLGKFIQVGSASFDAKIEITLVVHVTNGKQFIGSVSGDSTPSEYVPKMIQWFREGKLPVDRLVKFLPAAEFEKGLEGMHNGTIIKPILLW